MAARGVRYSPASLGRPGLPRIPGTPAAGRRSHGPGTAGRGGLCSRYGRHYHANKGSSPDRLWPAGTNPEEIQTVRCSQPDHGHLGKAAFGRTRQGLVGKTDDLTLQQVESRQQKEVATRDRRKKRQQTAHPGRSICVRLEAGEACLNWRQQCTFAERRALGMCRLAELAAFRRRHLRDRPFG